MTPSVVRRRTVLLAAAGALLGAAALVVAGSAAVLWGLPDVAFLADPSANLTVTVFDWDGEAHPFLVGPRNPSWTPLSRIPEHLQDAVVAAEDLSFYGHRGIDWFEVREALRRDLRERRFARGASTITQQVAKNLFLSREKTLLRKAREAVLARRLEGAVSKGRILELYLNLAEMGPLVHGVGEASWHWFGKGPEALSLRESSLLAATLPGPRTYDPSRRMGRVLERADRILDVMLRAGMIDAEWHSAARAERPRLRGADAEPVRSEAPVEDGSGTPAPTVPPIPPSAGSEAVPSGSADGRQAEPPDGEEPPPPP